MHCAVFRVLPLFHFTSRTSSSMLLMAHSLPPTCTATTHSSTSSTALQLGGRALECCPLLKKFRVSVLKVHAVRPGCLDAKRGQSD